MGVAVVDVPVELLEAPGAGVARLVPGLRPEAPLAEQTRTVAARPEHLGEGGVAGAEGALAAAVRVGADGRVSGVQAGEQGGPGGGADGGRGVGVGEPQPFGGEAVDARGGDQFLAVRAEVPVSEVVGQDHHQVGRRGVLGHRRGRGLRRPGQGGEAHGGRGSGEEVTAAGHRELLWDGRLVRRSSARRAGKTMHGA